MRARKNTKFFYYLRGISFYLCPKFFLRRRAKKLLAQAPHLPNYEYLLDRVNYYNKLSNAQLPDNAPMLSEQSIKDKNGGTVYFFDTFEYNRYFNQELHWFLKGGDVVTVPEHPTFVKSRPISDDNANSVILKLNKVRHFFYIKDTIPFEKKISKILFRGMAHGKPNRQDFIEKFAEHPKCDARDTAPHSINPHKWRAKNMSIAEHMNYRYIMALEGNDVASNLKWIMSSNSIAVMPRPKYETWFMEGRLIPNYHYIEIKSDYSDLIERIEYYDNHIDEAKEIIKHANEYVKQFKNKKQEDIISLMVYKKYFDETGQHL